MALTKLNSIYLYAMKPDRDDLPVWISATTDVRRSAGHVRRGCPVDVELVGSMDLVPPTTYSQICGVLLGTQLHGNWFERSVSTAAILQLIERGDTVGLANWLAQQNSENQQFI